MSFQILESQSKNHIIRLFLMICFLAMILACASRESLLQESTKHYEYGLIFLDRGDLPQAYEEFEKAKILSPENDQAYFGLGLILYFEGKFLQAKESYQKAIELNPQVPEYYNNMAAVLGKLGRWRDVIQYCQVALENPNYATPAYAYYNMGCAYLNLGKIQKAVEFLERSKKENPAVIDTHLQLGKAQSLLGAFQEAIENLNVAKNLEKDAPSEDFLLQAEIEHYLGQSYLGLGDVTLAKKAFSSSIEKAPHSRWAKESAGYLNHIQQMKKFR